MNPKELDKIINEINISDTYVRLIEIGAGLPVSGLIFERDGSSKTIYSSESLYSRESFEREFGKSGNRAICAARLKEINDDSIIERDMKDDTYNTVFSSTYQLHKDSTHGWISLKTNTKTRYYHISIHDYSTRKEIIDILGLIGLRILYTKNESLFSDPYIDCILDENLEPLYKETLDTFSSLKRDKCAVFTKDGNIERLEYITRDISNLIVYKGSFNPVTIAHKKLMETTVSRFEDTLYQPPTNAIFCINTNTFDKGNIPTEDLLDRIKYLNLLGFDVLISALPLFEDTINLIRKKYSGNIVIPMGIDTINRISLVYADVRILHIKQIFKGCTLIVYKRADQQLSDLSEILYKSDLYILDKDPIEEISSTMIRNASNIEDVLHYIPIEIQHLIIIKYKK